MGDGPKVARHHGGEIVDPDTVNRLVADEESNDLRRFLEQAIPSLAGPVQEAQVCLYTNSPDEHFILDRHPEHPNVLLVSPCSGHGFKFAPTVGEILADACQGVRSPYDLGPFRLQRFLPGDVT
jgi:glycine/D-amino acid oxidase-like deaminating enzyme